MSGQPQKYQRKRKLSLTGLIVALVILSGTWQPLNNVRPAKGKEQITRIQIKELEGALKLFFMDMGRYPASSEGLEALVQNLLNLDSWKGPYLIKELSKDPWNKPYIYRCPGQHGDYDLISCGPDSVEGSIDDIVSWKWK